MPVRLVFVVVSVGLLAFAPAPLPRPERPRSPTDVGGKWEFVTCELNGRPYESTSSNYKAEIGPKEFDFVPLGSGVRTSYEMRLDPSASPPAFTWSEHGKVVFVGSYRIKDGRLTLVFASGSRLESRPTDFAGRRGWRYVLRRVRS